MKVSELIELLEEQDPDAEVLVMSQENWPFECAIAGVATRDEILRADADERDEDDERDDCLEPGTHRNDVFIVEGEQLRYGSKTAWRVATRCARSAPRSVLHGMTLLGAQTEACTAKRSTQRTAMKTTIRATTTYVGSEHRYLRGYRVRIVAVLKADGNIIKDEDDLARAGGVTAEDVVEVQPWLEAEGCFSFVTSDPRAVDLACFERLLRA